METRALYGTNVTVNAKCVVYVCSICMYIQYIDHQRNVCMKQVSTSHLRQYQCVVYVHGIT